MGLENYTTISGLSGFINKQSSEALKAKSKNKKKGGGNGKKGGKSGQTKIGENNPAKKPTADKTTDEIEISPYERALAAAFLGSDDVNASETITSMVSNSLTGIEGMPYQFMGTVDRRLKPGAGPLQSKGVGRKYGEKILSRFPMLFIQPCTVAFMRGFSSNERGTVTEAVLTGNVPENFQELLENRGRFYTVDFAYPEYYKYLNCMLNGLAIYLGIGDKQVNIGKSRQKLWNARWNKEVNRDFKTFFSEQENLVFYVDGFSSVSQSFTNETGDSSLASTLNGFAEQINEIKFLFGTEGGVASEFAGMASEVSTSIMSGLSATLGKLGGGIVESLANNGVNTILNGGKIIFPEIWTNSVTDDGSATFDFKFRSPDNDTLSIYLNVLKPYCKLLCLTLPQQTKNVKTGEYDVNSYGAPFVLKAALKGKFAVDTGIISGLSVTKGSECQWNDDGLPTQIDVSVDIKNLYKNMAMSGYTQSAEDIVNNTAYMDFVANMAGLNILQQEIGRKARYYMYFTGAQLTGIPSNLASSASRAISSLMGRIYELTS